MHLDKRKDLCSVLEDSAFLSLLMDNKRRIQPQLAFIIQSQGEPDQGEASVKDG